MLRRAELIRQKRAAGREKTSSMSASSNDSDNLSWGTPESHWPFPRPVAAPEPEDRERFQALTPSQRVEWLVMMLRLLDVQFGHLVR